MVDGWEVRVCLFLLPLQGVITTRIHTQGDALGYMLLPLQGVSSSVPHSFVRSVPPPLLWELDGLPLGGKMGLHLPRPSAAVDSSPQAAKMSCPREARMVVYMPWAVR